MSGVNKVLLVGRVGKEPEVKHLGSGSTVANFSLATSEKFKNKLGEMVETTEWHNIVIWGKLAEVVEKWVHKGDLIYIEGKMRTRSWEKDGITHYATEIPADVMTMLGSKGGTQSNEPVSAPIGNESDDLPF